MVYTANLYEKLRTVKDSLDKTLWILQSNICLSRSYFRHDESRRFKALFVNVTTLIVVKLRRLTYNVNS